MDSPVKIPQTSAIHDHWANDYACGGTFIVACYSAWKKFRKSLVHFKVTENTWPLDVFWRIKKICFIQKTVTLPLNCCVTLKNHCSSVFFRHWLSFWLWDHQVVHFHHLWCEFDFVILSWSIHFFRGNSRYFRYHLIVNCQTISTSFKQRILLC